MEDDRIIIVDYNRDGAKIWLELIYDDVYSLKTDKPYVLEYMRLIYDSVPDDALIYDFNWNGKKAICRAVDPSGGPYISVGDIINKKYKILRIYEGIRIKLQKL